LRELPPEAPDGFEYVWVKEGEDGLEVAAEEDAGPAGA
jgi:hypothetical protein